MKRLRVLFVSLMVVCLSLCTVFVIGCGSKPKPVKYTVAFQTESVDKGTVSGTGAGSAIDSGVSLTKNTQIVLTAAPNAGYSFDGWYSDTQRVSTENPYSFALTAAVELEARFNAIKYALAFSSENEDMGTVDGNGVSSEVDFNQSVTLTATAKTGYEFIGWYDGNDSVSVEAEYTFNMPNNAVTLVAKFSAIKYALAFSSENELAGTVDGNGVSSEVAYNQSVTLTATAKTGYKFVGWFDDGALEPATTNATYTFSMPANARTLIAKFEALKYALAFSSENEDMGTVDGNGVSSEVDYNQSVTLTATARTGYEFIGWYDGNTSVSENAEYTFNMPNNAVTLVAKFQAIEYALAFSSQSEVMGTVNGNGVSSVVGYNQSVTLTATPHDGYEFAGWYEDDNSQPISTDAEYTFNMPNNAVTLVAKFNAIKYALVFSSENEDMGTVDGDGVSSEVAYNSSVILTATAKTGYKFKGWYEDGNSQPVSTDAIYTFNMPSRSRTLVAQFATDKFKLNFTVGTAGAGEIVATDGITNGNNVDFGKNVTLTVTESVGYDLVGWYANGGADPVCTEAQYAFEMPASEYTVVAVFKLEKRTITYWSDNAIDYTDTVDYNSTATEYTPSKAHHIFMGWFTAAGESGEHFDYSKPITQSLNLYARWKEDVKKYDVTYVCDGKVIYTQELNEGVNSMQPPAATALEGFDFSGWVYYDEAIEQNKPLLDEMNITGDLTVTATYTVKRLTVEFYTDETTQYFTDTVDYGGTAQVVSPTSETHLFVQWLDGTGSPFSLSNKITASIKLYAEWQVKPPKTFEVKFYDAKGGNLIDTKIVEQDKTISATAMPSAEVKEGYEFKGWYYNNGADVAFNGEVVISANLDVWAVYEQKTYTVTFKYLAADGSSAQAVYTVAHGGTADNPVDVMPDFPAREGYVFDKWDKAFSNVTANITVTAIYKANEITVYYKDRTDGSDLSNVKVKYGESLAVPNNPTKDGYSFAGWFTFDGDEATVFDFTKPVTVTDGEIYVYATFTEIILKKHTVTFQMANGDVINTQTVDDGYHAIVPSAPEVKGHDFDCWINADGGAVVDDFTNVTADLTVIANYVKKQYDVKFYDVNGELIKSVKVAYGDTAAAVAPVAPEVENKTFVDWGKAIDGIKIERDTEFYAQYASVTYTVNFYVYDAFGNEVLYLTAKVEHGGTADMPSTPAKVGYLFKYWSSTSTAGNLNASVSKYDFNTPILEETSLYAKFEKSADICIITFMVDGSQHGEIQQLPVGGYVTEPQPYVDGNGQVYSTWRVYGTDEIFDFNNTQVQTDIVLYIDTTQN